MADKIRKPKTTGITLSVRNAPIKVDKIRPNNVLTDVITEVAEPAIWLMGSRANVIIFSKRNPKQKITSPV